jgi:hypothetical protein
MLENKMLVTACLARVSAGAWPEVEGHHLEVLQTAGLIAPVDTPSMRIQARPARRFAYQLTPAGKELLWPRKSRPAT